MAKATKKDGSPRGIKLPKRIGGVKLPKELRHAGDALIAKANSPEGRAAIAKGVTLAAGAASAAVAAQRMGGVGATPHKTTADAASGARPSANGDAIAAAIGGAADMVLGRLFGAKK